MPPLLCSSYNYDIIYPTKLIPILQLLLKVFRVSITAIDTNGGYLFFIISFYIPIDNCPINSPVSSLRDFIFFVYILSAGFISLQSNKLSGFYLYSSHALFRQTISQLSLHRNICPYYCLLRLQIIL